MKVHFADMGCFNNADALIDCGVKYTLQTFHQIHKNKGKLSFSYDFLNQFRHIIIDSGLFSIMFGCDKDKHFDASVAENWQRDYIDWIKTSDFKNASFVELDVQKKLGPDYAWDLRERIRSALPDKSIINVYHLEDGNPDKLIDFSHYIAVSIPELRFNVSRKELIGITSYISSKAKSKGKKVHLLGCTDLKLMRQFDYCYSCDSTSWMAGSRFGTFKSKITGPIHVDVARSKLGFKGRNKLNQIAYCANIMLEEYKLYAGDQS